MYHYAGIDVSLEQSAVCVVDGTRRIVREAKVASEPAALIAWFGLLATPLARIGLEAGPLSQWLYAALREAGFAVELLDVSGRPHHADQADQELYRAEDLGDADRQARRPAQGQGGAGAQARGRPAPDARRRHTLQPPSQAGDGLTGSNNGFEEEQRHQALLERGPFAGTMDPVRPPSRTWLQTTHL